MPALPQDGAGATAPDPSTRLEAFNAEVTSLTAEFRQETWSAGPEGLVDTATGTFTLLRPGRFIWHTLTPYEHLVVADGTSIWMHDVDLEQVTRTDVEALPSANPGLLLSGDRAVSDDYEITRSYEVDQQEFIELVPRDARADYSRILVAFSGAALAALEIVDGLNQTTRIEFSDVTLNPDIDAARFVFEPPADASVIGN